DRGEACVQGPRAAPALTRAPPAAAPTNSRAAGSRASAQTAATTVHAAGWTHHSTAHSHRTRGSSGHPAAEAGATAGAAEDDAANCAGTFAARTSIAADSTSGSTAPALSAKTNEPRSESGSAASFSAWVPEPRRGTRDPHRATTGGSTWNTASSASASGTETPTGPRARRSYPAV